MSDETKAERWAAAKRELDYCDSEENRWKQATGLIMGGDPSDIEPHHLVDYRDHVSCVVAAARQVMRSQSSAREYPPEIVALQKALVDLDAAWPEQ